MRRIPRRREKTATARNAERPESRQVYKDLDARLNCLWQTMEGDLRKESPNWILVL